VFINYNTHARFTSKWKYSGSHLLNRACLHINIFFVASTSKSESKKCKEIVKPEGHTNRPNKTQIRLIFAKIHLPGMLSICCV
jgi:hypothetical protein